MGKTSQFPPDEDYIEEPENYAPEPEPPTVSQDSALEEEVFNNDGDAS